MPPSSASRLRPRSSHAHNALVLPPVPPPSLSHTFRLSQVTAYPLRPCLHFNPRPDLIPLQLQPQSSQASIKLGLPRTQPWFPTQTTPLGRNLAQAASHTPRLHLSPRLCPQTSLTSPTPIPGRTSNMARKATAMSTLSTTMRFRLRGSICRTVLLKPLRMPWLLVPEKGPRGHREGGRRAYCQLSHKVQQSRWVGGED